MMIPNHSTLAIIAEKDSAYQNDWLEIHSQELAQKFLGPRLWIQCKNSISVITRITYLGINYFSDQPTPGEELFRASFTNPTSLRKILLLLLQSLEFGNFIKEVHLITFFFFGDFYEISKRLTESTYQVNSDNQLENKLIFRFLGILGIIKLIINHSRDRDSKDTTSADEKSIIIDDKLVCPICSCNRKSPTSTLCGHIFCWHCIHECLNQKPECPLCKYPTKPSRLIHLINYQS